MRHVPAFLSTLLILSAATAPARADDTPAAMRALTACRAIADDGARLRCFDAAAAEADKQLKAGDLIVADRQQVRESRKALFGFGSIRLPIFAGHDADPEPEQIETTISRVSDPGYGKYEYVLANGMVWRQVEPGDFTPRSGQSVTIKRAALGSYFLKVGKQSGVRAMRVR